MCIPVKNNLCKTPPNARYFYIVEKNRHIVDRERLDSQKKIIFVVIFLSERTMRCDAAFGNGHY